MGRREWSRKIVSARIEWEKQLDRCSQDDDTEAVGRQICAAFAAAPTEGREPRRPGNAYY